MTITRRALGPGGLTPRRDRPHRLVFRGLAARTLQDHNPLAVDALAHGVWLLGDPGC